jgi:hypothetical protein
MVQTGGNATNAAQTTALTSSPVPTTVPIVIVEGTVGHVVTVASPTVATGDAGGTAAATTGALALGEGAGALGAGLVIPPLAAAYVPRQLFFDENWQIRPEAQEFVKSLISLASGDVDMPKSPEPKVGPRGNLSATGEPNSSEAEATDDSHGKIRDYGPDGKAKTDYDFGHDHGAGDPHAHDWDWSSYPPRQPGRPLLPGE